MRPRASAQLIALLALVAALAVPALAQAGTGNAAAGNDGSGNQGKPGKSCAKKRAGKKHCSQGKPGPKVGATEGDCPSGASECRVDIELVQASPTTGGICDSFEDVSSGTCLGSSRGTTGWSNPGYSPRYGIQNWFSWTSQGAQRNVEYMAKSYFTTVEAYIRGNVPSPSSAVFNVTDAWNRATDAHWQTVSTGGAPGSKGGPLYIDYDHKLIGSSVHFWGWLVRK